MKKMYTKCPTHWKGYSMEVTQMAVLQLGAEIIVVDEHIDEHGF